MLSQDLGTPRSIKEAAKRMGISTRFLYKLTSEGKIPHVRIGSKILIFDQDSEDFMMKRRIGGAV